MHVGDYLVSIQYHLGLEGGQRQSDRTSQTYVEDLKDPDQVRFPTADGLLVTFCMGKSGEQVPFPFPGDLLLDFCHGSAIKGAVRGARSACIVD